MMILMHIIEKVGVDTRKCFTHELHGIQDFERRQVRLDEQRERKRAEMNVRNQNYFDRMKQMVITDGVDQNQKKLTY